MRLSCEVLSLIFIFLLSYFDMKLAQNDNKCTSQKDCKSCIRMHGCVWCATPVTSGSLPNYRCEDSKEVQDGWCNYTINPINSHRIPKEHNTPLGKIDGTAIQITPQRIELQMRVGESHTFEFHYGVVEDYPVDLYYIMDLSKSMYNHKMNLAKLGNSLSKTMQNITENFRIGFGSFVDKVEMPYVSTVPESLNKPCSLNNGTTPCVPPYSFKNHMPLNNNTAQFSIEVEAAQVSGNLDNPEGGFDAIMQAIVCKEEIGWRENARRLLVYSSDAPFHFAGDGKLAGVVEPHDGRCYMENGTYTHALVFDYPSVGQINEKVQEHNINLIFAVTEGQETVYGNLSERLERSSYGILSGDSGSVIKLVRDQYDHLLETVKIIDNSSQFISIKYLTNCLKKDNPFSEGNSCDGLKYEDGKSNVTFKANITVKKCPENRADWTQFIKIKPSGVNDSLIVKLDIICDCDCKDSKLHLPDACNNHGRLECGVCVCNPSYSGKRCECEKSNSTVGNQTECIAEGTNVTCSGAGICKCGVCECNPRQNPSEVIDGKYCECDNYSCKRGPNRKLCSGEDHGTCVCGSCQCLPGWSGEKCECSEESENCIPKGGGPACSDRGKCVCGKCVCDSTSYEGQYCELCPICPGGACNELKSCVECEAYTLKGCLNCSIGLNLTLQDIVTEESVRNEENTGFCRFPDDNDCTFSFIYRKVKEGNFYHVVAEKEKHCSDVNILGVVLGVIGSIVFIGLLTLIIWKILTSIHDEREYSKFEKERAQAKFSRDDNPLYVKATSTYSNPTFHENS